MPELLRVFYADGVWFRGGNYQLQQKMQQLGMEGNFDKKNRSRLIMPKNITRRCCRTNLPQSAAFSIKNNYCAI